MIGPSEAHLVRAIGAQRLSVRVGRPSVAPSALGCSPTRRTRATSFPRHVELPYNDWMSNPSDQDLKTLLTNAATIAIVGASSNPERSSYGIMQRLQQAGYRVIPINPREAEILGEKAYASLSDVQEPIDIVDVFRRAEDTPPIADEAVKVGAKALWLQSGIASDDAKARATAGGLTVVMDACIATIHSLLRVPGKRRA